MTKQRAIGQLENLKEHCNEMKWESDVIALDVAIECLKNDRDKMIVNDIKRIIIPKYQKRNWNIRHRK